MDEQVRPRREGFVKDEPRAKPAREPEATAAPPVDTVQQPVETWPIKVKLLHRKIMGNKNETLDELSFREPTGGDINRVGNPVRIDSTGEIVIEERKMTLMMATLSGVLSPLLDQLDPRDWNSCAYRLRRFFLPDPEAW
jgi:hypothetical protein